MMPECKKRMDCHAHVFPAKVAINAVDSIGSFYQLPMAGSGTIHDLSALHQQAGITHRVISSTATRPEQVAVINRFMLHCAQKNSTTISLGTLHPSQPDEDIVRTLDEITASGLRGVKLHPDFQRFPADGPFAVKAARLMADRRLVLLIHAGDPRQRFSNPEQIERLAAACPDTKIIAAHLGGWGHWKDAAQVLAKWQNVFVDTSSSLPFITQEEAIQCIRTFGAHRVLFGTDYPMWRPADEYTRLMTLPLTVKEQEMILWENGSRLFHVF